MQLLKADVLVGRGVTRLNGARGKKQVWRPHIRTWGISEANVLYWRKHLWHYWDFWVPVAVIRLPGNCASLAPFVTPLLAGNVARQVTADNGKQGRRIAVSVRLFDALLSDSRWIGNPINHSSTTVSVSPSSLSALFSTIPDSANPTSRGRLGIWW